MGVTGPFALPLLLLLGVERSAEPFTAKIALLFALAGVAGTLIDAFSSSVSSSVLSSEEMTMTSLSSTKERTGRAAAGTLQGLVSVVSFGTGAMRSNDGPEGDVSREAASSNGVSFVGSLRAPLELGNLGLRMDQNQTMSV